MSVFTKVLLSSSTNGKGISVIASQVPGNTIHTAISGSSSMDEVWIYTHNTAATAVNLTLGYGGSDCTIAASIPSLTGLTLFVPGLILNNSKEVSAFASASGVEIFGFVNRIT